MKLHLKASRKYHQIYQVIRWTWDLSSGNKSIIACFIVASLLNSLTEGFTVMLIVPILNSAGTQNAFAGVPLLHEFGGFFQGLEATTRLRWLASLIFLVILLRGALQYIVDIIIYVVPFNVEQTLRLRAFRLLTSARLSFVDKISIGEISNYVAGFPARAGIAVRFLSQLVSSAITAILMLFLLLSITPGILFIIGIAGVILSISFKKLTGRWMIDVSRSLTDTNRKYNEIYHEAIANRKAVKIFRAGELFAQRVFIALDQLRRVQIKMLALQAATYPFFSTAAGLIAAAGIFSASFLDPAQAQAMLAILIVSLVIMFRIIGPVTIIHICRMHFVTHVEAIEGLYRFLREAKDAEDADGTRLLDGIRGEIAFDHVFFSYDGGKDVLSDISFTAKPGQMIALVGKSGGGKSTLFYLLTRLYRPTAGRILIDGVDLNEIAIDSFWRKVSFLSQDNPIFVGTVKENISFGDNRLKDLQLYNNAIDLAAAREFIDALPHENNSQIGEGSRVLSGGERQRLALARVFYAEPQIVLFDEATSHLDAISEAQVKAALDQLRRKGCTVFVIAHRLSTIQGADHVMVLDQGKLVESGPFKELATKDGLFSRMIESQSIIQ